MSHATKLEEKHYTLPKSSIVRKLPALGLIGLALIGVATFLGLTGDIEQRAQFYFSYLTGYVYALTIALGALFFVMVQYLSRAGWSVGIRRLAENLAATLPIFALLAIPFLIPKEADTADFVHHEPAHEAHAEEAAEHGAAAEAEAADGAEGHHGETIAASGIDFLYAHWVHAPADDELVNAKKAYLNTPFFYVRALVCFAMWIFLALYFYRRSTAQDTSGDRSITRKLQMVAAPGIVAFALTSTVAAIDWLMSLNPHWFSTIWGVYFFAGSMIAIFATLSILSVWFEKMGHMGPAVTVEHRQDLGKFLFGFVVFWSYIAFSQYMLIWYAQMPEETVFYADRLVYFENGEQVTSSWASVSMLLMAAHFAFPFFFMMSKHIKRNNLTLVFGCVWLLVVHFIDIYWIVMPALHPRGYSIHFLDFVCVAGTVLTLLGAFAWVTTKHALVPIKDPRLSEALRFENV